MICHHLRAIAPRELDQVAEVLFCSLELPDNRVSLGSEQTGQILGLGRSKREGAVHRVDWSLVLVQGLAQLGWSSRRQLGGRPVTRGEGGRPVEEDSSGTVPARRYAAPLTLSSRSVRTAE